MRHSSRETTRSRPTVECLEDRRVLATAGLLGGSVILPPVSVGVEIHIASVASVEISVSYDATTGQSSSPVVGVNAQATASVGRVADIQAAVNPAPGEPGDPPITVIINPPSPVPPVPPVPPVIPPPPVPPVVPPSNPNPQPPVTPPTGDVGNVSDVGTVVVIPLDAVTTPASGAGLTSERFALQIPVPIDAPRRELTASGQDAARASQLPLNEESVESAGDTGPSELITGRGVAPRGTDDENPADGDSDGMAAITSAVAEAIDSGARELMENPQSAAPVPTIADVLAAGIPFDLLRNADDLEALLSPSESAALQEPQGGPPLGAWIATAVLAVAAAELTRRHFRRTGRQDARPDLAMLSGLES